MISQGPQTPGGEITLLDYLKRYCLEHDLQLNSERQLYYAILCLQGFVGAEVTLGELSDDLINEWLRDQQGRNLANDTVRGKRVNIVTLWKAAYESKVIDHQPGRIRKIRKSSCMPIAWTVEEVRKLVKAAERIEGWFRVTGIKRSLYWSAKIRFAWDTGLRTGDIHRVEASQIDEERKFAVRQHKTGGWMIRQLHPSTWDALKRTFPPKRETFFPLWARREECYKQFRQLVAAAGMKGTFKKLRKSGATNCEGHEPGSAEAYLGHARSLNTAERHYIDRRLIRERIVIPEPLDGPDGAAEPTEDQRHDDKQHDDQRRGERPRRTYEPADDPPAVEHPFRVVRHEA